MERKMKILVTGSKGFIGKNLIATLDNLGKYEIFGCDVETTDEELTRYASECEFVFHLAGVNRPQNKEEFYSGNYGFTTVLLDKLKASKNTAPVLMSSSIQAKLDNDYGKSKKEGEDYLINYGKENGVKVYVFRLPNVFGKWCRPNYNSAIATFCYNIARDLPVTVTDRNIMLTTVYIDDVVDAFLSAIKDEVERDEDGYCVVAVTHKVTLGTIVDLIESFKESRKTLACPHMEKDGFEKKLYSTYLASLPEDGFSYELKMNKDDRGSFTEFLRTPDYGQVSVNVSRPHIVKGNHWHHTKNEKFVVVSGHGLIQLRKIGTDEVLNFEVSGDKIEVVEMLPGYTHNIINLSETEDLVTFMWANEAFDPENPDTIYLEV